ncbi:major facilitator superfamily transporter [Fusarium oxysporum f. sp. phaseoli]
MTSKLDGFSFQDSRTTNHRREIPLHGQLPEAANQDVILDTFDETFRVEFEGDHDPFSPRNMPLLNQWLIWRWTYYLILVWATILLLGVAFVPETFQPIVFKIKARKLRSEAIDDRYWASGERMNKAEL